MIIVSSNSLICLILNLYFFKTALKKATRFGAKPDFGSTFVNFQHPDNAPGFMAEKTRFEGTSNNFLTRECKASRTETSFKASTLNDKVSFQQEDKMKK